LTPNLKHELQVKIANTVHLPTIQSFHPI